MQKYHADEVSISQIYLSRHTEDFIDFSASLYYNIMHKNFHLTERVPYDLDPTYFIFRRGQGRPRATEKGRHPTEQRDGGPALLYRFVILLGHSHGVGRLSA